jgi:FAD synthetase
MAQGVFDVLHPGHLFYLEESAKLGDELHVVIARDERIEGEKDLAMDERSRQHLLQGLEVVDKAHLGTTEDIYDILDVVEPDVLTLGHDQPFDIGEIKTEHERRGHEDIEVVRIDEYDSEDHEITSSSEIKRRLRERSES